MAAKLLTFVAFLLIGSGVLAGLMPVTSEGEACGSAFVAASLPDYMMDETRDWRGEEQDYRNRCEDVRNLVRIPATVLVAAGATTLIAAFFSRRAISVARN
ncbi:hypothetical protein Nocox_02680 [Nonomuraea coxensis DSM 45129]|uniref:Uncharacterized protein n=1 Tax=Nonomuraea coxensis DSM 45129 TaxID=1122611 RepID=A0ABX8TSR5_9ACTN|nr:hypothetical protein [Nonomuraea coxensis]QYC38168.1 hypothetical protein Nocox_02680 [Nonomuraea coxensis DSM 45129]